MRPKKSLGQCFLVNRHAARRIASLLEIQPTDRILEIGGGRGDLTVFLLAGGARVYSVEIDHRLAEELHRRFSDRENLSLIEMDILELDPTEITDDTTGFKLVGNIPYHLSSKIVEWMIKYYSLFGIAVFTVQRELAERLTASPGSKQFGSLTVFAQVFYSARKIFNLRPGSFFPPPKVNSSVVRLERLPQSLIDADELMDLRRLTRACFRWRRKQIIRILREEYRLEKQTLERLLQHLSIAVTSRPEQLSVTDFVMLSRELKCVNLESP